MLISFIFLSHFMNCICFKIIELCYYEKGLSVEELFVLLLY